VSVVSPPHRLLYVVLPGWSFRVPCSLCHVACLSQQGYFWPSGRSLSAAAARFPNCCTACSVRRLSLTALGFVNSSWRASRSTSWRLLRADLASAFFRIPSLSMFVCF
jgi:hypothetical protein